MMEIKPEEHCSNPA